VYHRPDPGGGAGGSERRSTEPAPRILLVEDEFAIRTICRVNLESDGLAVVEAADGREALAGIRQERPELVLLDVMMPDVDGWEVAEQLAADPHTQDIPVVFLSARAAREDKARAQGLGAVGYIVKPFDPVMLGAAVKDVLERIRRGEREQLNRELYDPE
jgi:DNA-binding response OmpR family regulator